ncbi:hypothetical protein [Paenibacillus alkalitolerans]|uniref:hypothetical protein n=1 Tax=Paenibacillus alkalitolerans TaxID=2799335 RepID=UPI0018F39CD1|nr:hypothetical protein [Paenibacillus alkalitolerans]
MKTLEVQGAPNVKLTKYSGWTHEFEWSAAGFLELTLTIRADSDWSVTDRESALIDIHLDGVYNQTVITHMGERDFPYVRLLGWVEAGEHKLSLAFSRYSSPLAQEAALVSFRIERIEADSEKALVYKHAPVLHYRQLAHPYESRYTDTPMLTFYLTYEEAGLSVIEYHTLYSHEDEGTAAPLLMSKWGRLTDIEWAYRVYLNAEGGVVKAEYQGPHHKTTTFAGGYALGGHPVLQAATGNGNVTDEPLSHCRCLLPPVYRWHPESEPRERVMDLYPFTYQMMCWELRRQARWESPADSDTIQLADPRSYLYVQTSKYGVDRSLKTSVDIQVKLTGEPRWYSSSFGDRRAGSFRAAYDGPYERFSTAVKLPDGMSVDRIEEIRVSLLPGGEDRMTVKGLKAFFLDESFLPGDALMTDIIVDVTADEPSATLWKGNRNG